MTQRDADRLKLWVDGMTRQQLGLLWRWIMLEYMQRCAERR